MKFAVAKERRYGTNRRFCSSSHFSIILSARSMHAHDRYTPTRELFGGFWEQQERSVGLLNNCYNTFSFFCWFRAWLLSWQQDLLFTYVPLPLREDGKHANGETCKLSCPPPRPQHHQAASTRVLGVMYLRFHRLYNNDTYKKNKMCHVLIQQSQKIKDGTSPQTSKSSLH